MNILITSDLHLDHGRSRRTAQGLAEHLTALGRAGEFDVLLVVGDTATARGDALERGLSLLEFDGPRLFTLGNHELWSDAPDTWTLYNDVLPRRLAAIGWHCLDHAPAVIHGVAFLGSVGWYDYRFAPAALGIPTRFYAAKVSPGAALSLEGYHHLVDGCTDIPPAALEVVARWNDGRFVRLPFSDSEFTDRLLQRLHEHASRVVGCRHVVAAIHHLPTAELLPPASAPASNFARAFLGSPRFGELLGGIERLRLVVCGHSHFPACSHIAGVPYLATGSGYRVKRYVRVRLDAAGLAGLTVADGPI